MRHARRWLLLTMAVIAVLLRYSSATAPQPRPTAPAPSPAFGFEDVQRIARQRAAADYQDRSTKLPESISKLNYDQYRDIRYRPDHALWRGQALFEVQFFHRGFAFSRQVNINEVGPDGMAHPISYDPSEFDFGKNPRVARNLPADLGYAGFRVHYPLQTARLQGRADRVPRRVVFSRPRPRSELRGFGARPGHQCGHHGRRGVSLFQRFLAGPTGARSSAP